MTTMMRTPSPFQGDGDSALGEFGRIQAFFRPLTEEDPDAAFLLDDAALLRALPGQDLVVTTDTIVRGIHYLEDAGPEEIARRLLRVNLSDLAAKGAAPWRYLLSIATPPAVDDAWIAAFAHALGVEQRRFGMRLLGGDSVATIGPEILTLTAFGLTPAGAILRRGGARPDDVAYVSGTIGDAALGLCIASGVAAGPGGAAAAFLEARFRVPEPRLALGQALRGIAAAAMDVSDGLVGDLATLALASGCGARLDAAATPLSVAAAAWVHREPAVLETVLTGGDDYELLFAVPPERTALAVAAARAAATTVTPIGVFTAVPPGEVAGVVRVLGADGRQMTLQRTKFAHGRSGSGLPVSRSSPE